MTTRFVLGTALISIFCSNLETAQQTTPSVNFYVHDIDAARLVMKRDRAAYEKEIARLASTPQEMVKFMSTESPIVNAGRALNKIHTAFQVNGAISKCFGGKLFSAASTASTDHACVDAAGFKR